MVMNPSTNICKINAYPDADFAAMYGHEKPVLILHVQKVALGLLLHLLMFRFFGNHNCRQKQLFVQWRPKS
jgi:hypothetical protein